MKDYLLFLWIAVCLICVGLYIKKQTQIVALKNYQNQHIYVMEKTNIDENDDSLILAIISVESAFNRNARSRCNAIGLMQVRYKIWREELKTLGITNERELFNPNLNIKAGRYILGIYLKESKGDLQKALHKYSGGEENYYQKVMAAYKKY